MNTSKPEHGPDLAEQSAAAPPAVGSYGLPAVRMLPAPMRPAPVRPRRRIWIWAAGLVLAGGLGLGLYLQPWATGPIPVAVETAALAPVTRVLAVNGRIAALHSLDVRALVGGTLSAVHVAEGDGVETGMELAQIEDAGQQAILRQAVAGREAVLVALSQATATLARTEALGSNVARTALEAAERAVQTAAQEVARATALVDQAQLQLDNYTIRAPMTGTVLALHVEAGQAVDPSSVLMTIADLDRLIVVTDVDEAYSTQISAGLPAVMQLVGDAATRTGRVSFVSQRVEPATGGLAVQLVFDDPVLAPVGLTVTTNIIVDSQSAAITVPRTSIETGETGDTVFVVVDGTAQRRAVSLVDWPAARLIVTEGLVAGDVLILDATGITDGQAVRVVQP